MVLEKASAESSSPTSRRSDKTPGVQALSSNPGADFESVRARKLRISEHSIANISPKPAAEEYLLDDPGQHILNQRFMETPTPRMDSSTPDFHSELGEIGHMLARPDLMDWVRCI